MADDRAFLPSRFPPPRLHQSRGEKGNKCNTTGRFSFATQTSKAQTNGYDSITLLLYVVLAYRETRTNGDIWARVRALIIVAQHEPTPPAALKRGAAGQGTEKRARSLSPLLSHQMNGANQSSS